MICSSMLGKIAMFGSKLEVRIFWLPLSKTSTIGYTPNKKNKKFPSSFLALLFISNQIFRSHHVGVVIIVIIVYVPRTGISRTTGWKDGYRFRLAHCPYSTHCEFRVLPIDHWHALYAISGYLLSGRFVINTFVFPSSSFNTPPFTKFWWQVQLYSHDGVFCW